MGQIGPSDDGSLVTRWFKNKVEAASRRFQDLVAAFRRFQDLVADGRFQDLVADGLTDDAARCRVYIRYIPFKKLASTNNATVPTTMNTTYCRSRPVCKPRSESPME